ncbi:DUF4419 domain-containing protein [Myxococcus sp. CA040A]|uniref:DUF4419 domain-containing protein n=1 Tax=Myxococcus sp. CA040A TaxID=2741738 RepID=UPI00157A7009|nr:DUF4419 domain-containing protein [Myxococcus sp. CA040A]NTX05414.1 DUF4419 domain-containing protein [Myxococcus sp. CA040A]
MTTFAVDSVEEAVTPLETVPLGSLVGEALWLAPAADTRVVDPEGVHPLLAAVHIAFAEHRPLVLSPDVVWLTLAQGFAHHIRLHSETLRGRLVRHSGRRTLTVGVSAAPRTEEEFGATLTSFRELLREELGPGLPRLLSCDFSTSTDVERMAGDVVLMDAMSPYFDFAITVMCGIPRITLLGTPEDWRAIRRRIDVLAEFDLGWWTSSLIPIVDEFVRTSEGHPDRELWSELYKPRRAYGWDRASGWVTRLFPYVGNAGRFNRRNPILEQSHADMMKSVENGDENDWHWGPGLALHEAPAGLSCVPLHLSAVTSDWSETWSLEAGVLAVAVDSEGALVPRAGGLVRRSHASMSQVIERIVAEHSVTRATEASTFHGVAELNALYDHLARATLFPDTMPWRLRSTAEHTEVHIPVDGNGDFVVPVRCLVDLPDGTVLALRYCSGRRPHCYVRLRSDALEPLTVPPGKQPEDEVMLELERVTPPLRSRQTATDIPVVGPSLTELLSHALEHGGSTELPVLRTLVEELEPWENPPPRAPMPQRRK